MAHSTDPQIRIVRGQDPVSGSQMTGADLRIDGTDPQNTAVPQGLGTNPRTPEADPWSPSTARQVVIGNLRTKRGHGIPGARGPGTTP